jgi:alkylation response protein AidB-like acyl-CoA dehydrogenase
MDLLLSQEQRLLQDSVAGQLAALGGVKRARGLRGKDGGFDPAVLKRMGAEGWLGLLVPQEAGGLGLGPTELALVMQEAGRHLAPEPIAAASLSAMAFAGSETPWAAGVRDDVVAGKLIVVPVFISHRTGGVTADIAKVRAGSSGVASLSGAAVAVPHPRAADGYLIEGVTGGLCYVEKGAAGLTVQEDATVDGRALGRLRLSDTPGRMLAGRPDLASRLFDLSLLMASAELLGVMSAALDMTVDYLKTRTQFGKPIGSFQALQHRAVDDFTRIVSSRSLVFQVLGQGERLTPAMAAAVKSHVSGEALTVTKSAIQMHGAIGFTDDHDIGLYLKRAMWLSAYLGNAAVHRRRFAALTSAAR